MSAKKTAAGRRPLSPSIKGGFAPASNASQEDMHMGEPGLFHKLIRMKKLEGVFLFITSKCNSKCRTCFYHDKLNSKDDMSFDEIKRISETSPKFDKLWLSGGEPFLRKELVEIIKLFYDRNGVRVINLPTNGLLGEKIVDQTARLLAECPELTVHLNFSLDGLGKTHDKVRGIPGSFATTIKTMMSAKKRFGNNPRLLQNVATVITPDGYNELFDLGAYLLKKDLVATHFFEIVRGNPKDPMVKSLTLEQIKSFRRQVQPLIEMQADNLFKDFAGIKRKFAKFFFIGFIKFVTEVQEANYCGPSHWGMDCTAGKTTFVIDHNGDFRSCEMRPPIGNLRDYGFNLTKALYSEAMKREIEEIGGGSRANCWCTHGCWVMSSLKFSPRALLFRIPSAYFRFKNQNDPEFRMPEIDFAAIERSLK